MDPELPTPDEDHPRAGVRVRRRRRLQLAAAQQAGCFTVAQAAAAGFDRRARYHHLSFGNWRPTDAPGVYRLTSWPPDERERVRAWSLTTGGAPATAWTALDLLGITVAGPRQPVHLSVPDDRRRAVLDAGVCSPPADVRLHPRQARGVPSLSVDGIPTRPVPEALCVAVMRSRSRTLPLELTAALIDTGAVDLRELMHTASAVGASAVLDRFWDQFQPRRSHPA